MIIAICDSASLLLELALTITIYGKHESSAIMCLFSISNVKNRWVNDVGSSLFILVHKLQLFQGHGNEELSARYFAFCNTCRN